MKKPFFLIAIILFSITTMAQDTEEEVENTDKKGFKKENLFFGGNFGLMFGTNTLINISPQLGYRFNRRLAAGIGLNGQYQSQRYFLGPNMEARTKLGIVGLNLFGRFFPIEQIMLQVQPEANYVFGNISYNDGPSQTYDASIVPSLLLGGGYVVPSGRSSFIISVFYDVLQNERSPYGKRPIYNVGYNIGF